MEKAGKILKDMIEEAGLEKGNRFMGIFNRWKEIVGDPLCDHVEIVDILNNALLVQIDHPGWFQMFQFSESKILRRIRKSYPDLSIRAIKVRVVSEVEKAVVERLEKEEVRNDKREEHVDAETIGKMKDGELFNALNRLYRSIIKRNRKSSRG